MRRSSIGLLFLLLSGCWADFPKEFLDAGISDLGDDDGIASDGALPNPDGAANGASCEVNMDCASLHCVARGSGKICCSESCTGACEACSAAGTCSAVGAAQPPPVGKTCIDQTGTNDCGQDGLCDGAGACRVVAQGTPCGTEAVTCNVSILNQLQCDGQGACVATEIEDCGFYRCINGTPSMCRTSCNNDNHCESGNCVPVSGPDKCCAPGASSC